MCFGKSPTINVPQQPLMPQFAPLPEIKIPPPPKQLFTPSPISASAEDFGTGTMKSGLKGKTKKKKTNVATTKINLKIDPNKGGINTAGGGINA